MTLLTVLRELDHVVENRAVSIKRTHPGKHHAAAVRGIQGGQKVLRGMRQLAVKEKRKEDKKNAQQNQSIFHSGQLYRQLKAHDIRLA